MLDTKEAQISARERIHTIIFEAETKAGKLFDICLLIAIVLSVIIVALESVSTYQAQYGQLFFILEWFFTILFTIEYGLRIYAVYKPWKYITSFFGIIDLISILPTYLSLFVVGTQSLVVIRSLRLLRIFRIFKLANYLHEGMMLVEAIKASRIKIMVFLFFISIMIVICGSTMYLIESNYESGFDSIPRSIYWAVVTLTTVGYGDISPVTPFGQFVASIIMIIGYAVIAVPTGIVTNEIVKINKLTKKDITTQTCHYCSLEGQDADAIFCKHCGETL